LDTLLPHQAKRLPEEAGDRLSFVTAQEPMGVYTCRG
jgi:hypothetical protein